MTEPTPGPTPTDLPFETASWARRIAALVVDWLACTLVVAAFLGWGSSQGSSRSAWVLLLFVVESTVLTTLAGGSFGKLATRLRTVRVPFDPRPLDPLRSLARQILVAIVVPPLIFRPDGRGLHDTAAGTATVTLETYRQLAQLRG